MILPLGPDVKAFALRGVAQARIEADKGFAVRLFLAPDERRGQLQGIGRSQGMHRHQPCGTPAHLIGRRHRIGVFNDGAKALTSVPRGRITATWD